MNLGNARWIWCAERRPNTYCCARGRLNLPTLPKRSTLHVVADSRYQVWVNGQYVGQGPTPYKRPHIFVDFYDVTKLLRVGENVVAVLGNYHGVKHCTYTPGPPGILARLESGDGELVTDTTWRAVECTAYQRDVPRRTWATAWCEYYDARRGFDGWEQPGFDDSAWANAQIVEQGELKLYPRMVAPLEEFAVSPASIVGAWFAEPGVPTFAAVDEARADYSQERQGLTKWLDEEPLRAASVSERTGDTLAHARGSDGSKADRVFPFVIQRGEHGFAFAVDMGREIAGQLELDVDAPAGVVIDLCPAELLRGDRPWCYRKKGEYARRYITRDGRQRWRGFGYDGVRYIHVVVRGPHPALTIHRVGVWRRQSALPIRATFRCGDAKINRIWDITCHSMRVGSQEIHIDCPTREQTSAWGDCVWTGLRAAYMTGDVSALRHLMLSAEHVQEPDGQMPCYAFSELHTGPLFDYSLIAVWGIWVYLRWSGDRDLAERLVPVGDRVLDWYRKQIGKSGLIELDCEAIRKANKGLVFIDHPGLGWHTAPVGIDRRGINAALNFFFINALEAQANVRDHLGQPHDLRAEADRVRAAAAMFFDPKRGVYVDGLLDGRRLEQVSQQTNALAVGAGVCAGEGAGPIPLPDGRGSDGVAPDVCPAVLARILRDDPQLCRCGTYFWTYLAEALCRSGMHREMWREVVRLWDDMAERGATTWWETFLGDELDSLCHLWSCVPGYLILAEILGVQPAEPGFSRILVRPRIDLLDEAEGTVPLPGGEVRVAWRKGTLRVEVTADAPCAIELPEGWTISHTGSRSAELAGRSQIELQTNGKELG